MKKWQSLLLILSFCSCASQKTAQNPDELVCIQIVDRNGMAETISAPERLQPYQKLNFQEPQPYKQVLRIFTKDTEGKSRSKITNYHPNGSAWQYLEAKDTRANGKFLEWHPNGKLKIEATILEGPADLSATAQKDWVFDGICRVWDEDGNLSAEISYVKGALEGENKYYHANGNLSKILPYAKDTLHGELCSYFENGKLLAKTFYDKGEKTGPSLGFWENENPSFIESYEKNKLVTGIYWDRQNNPIAEVQKGSGFKSMLTESADLLMVEIQNGFPEGKVEQFNSDEELVREYHVKNGQKQGEEIVYYLENEKKAITANGKPLPKLLLHWDQDFISGTVKTWYDSGKPESQKEMRQNKKNGMSCSWYEDGSVMFIEEYENDKLLEGSYFRFREKTPCSKVTSGSGTATLFEGKNGHFIRKVNYVNGLPQE
jgi:antitoxin component YwqK of YwqJK toxin-antitoxin module